MPQLQKVGRYIRLDSLPYRMLPDYKHLGGYRGGSSVEDRAMREDQ